MTSTIETILDSDAFWLFWAIFAMVLTGIMLWLNARKELQIQRERKVISVDPGQTSGVVTHRLSVGSSGQVVARRVDEVDSDGIK